MDKQLRREQEKFKAIFQNASLGILVINQTGNITLANDFLVRQFGYLTADELVGKKMEILIPKRYHHQHVRDRDHYMEHPQTRPMGMGRDLFGIKKDGTEMPLEISLSSYSSDEEVFSIAFISDISPRIEVQNKLREQRLALA
jgi:PAS domain S-box-containing protein